MKPPDYAIKTNYTIREIVHSLLRDCPKKTDTTCSWSLTSESPYRQHEDTLRFQLTSENLLGMHTQYFVIDHFAIVKPGVISNVTLLSSTPSSASFAWQVPAYFDEEDEEDILTPQLVYEIRVEAKRKLLDYPQTISVGRAKSFNITGLTPNNEYVFSFRCKTTKAVEDRMWSDFINVTFTTQQDGKSNIDDGSNCFVIFQRYS